MIICILQIKRGELNKFLLSQSQWSSLNWRCVVSVHSTGNVNCRQRQLEIHHVARILWTDSHLGDNNFLLIKSRCANISSNWNLFRPLVKALFSNNAGTVNDGVKLPWNVCCRRQRQLKSQRMPIPQIQLIRRTYKSGQVDQSDKPEFWRFVHDRGQVEEIAKALFHTSTPQVNFQGNSLEYLIFN